MVEKMDEAGKMDYLITDYGAVPDGRTNARHAIQRALDDCSLNGGGRVVVPAGKFLSGTLRIRSNTELYLAPGAVIIASLAQDDILQCEELFAAGEEGTWLDGGFFLCAFHEKNITLSGQGMIEGQGEKVFSEVRDFSENHEYPKIPLLEKRPRLTFFEDVQNLTVRDITFRNACFWTLHLAGCRDVLVDGIRIFNDPRGANNDGIDPDTCRNVVIRGCIIETGDDAIVVKNSKEMASKYGTCENIIIMGCVLASHDSALKIGTETFLGIRHVIMSDCVFSDCSRGVGIWARDGAVIEDISVHHVTGSTRRWGDCPIGNRYWWGKGEPVFLDAAPRESGGVPGMIRKVSFDHLTMDSQSCIFLSGEENAVLEDISIKDCTFRMHPQTTGKPDVFDEQPSVRNLYKHEIPALFARHVNRLTVQAEILRDPSMQSTPLTEQEACSHVRIELAEEEK